MSHHPDPGGNDCILGPGVNPNSFFYNGSLPAKDIRFFMLGSTVIILGWGVDLNNTSVCNPTKPNMAMGKILENHHV